MLLEDTIELLGVTLSLEHKALRTPPDLEAHKDEYSFMGLNIRYSNEDHYNLFAVLRDFSEENEDDGRLRSKAKWKVGYATNNAVDKVIYGFGYTVEEAEEDLIKGLQWQRESLMREAKYLKKLLPPYKK